MTPFLRRQFWLTLWVFVIFAITGLALGRLYVAYKRVKYSHTQAAFFADLVLDHDGNPTENINEIERHSSDLGLPFEFKEIDPATAPPQVPEEVRRELPHSKNLLSVTVRPPPTLRTSIPITYLCLIIAAILGTILSIYLLYKHLRLKAEIAKCVFRRIQAGDLKARFPVTKLDEFGQALVLFNDMADEIERLVEQLREKERARTQLLQELAHDLRTPVSSLRNLIESLRFSGPELNVAMREELLGLAYQESEYLTYLVEDLLFLALVLEPHYVKEPGAVDLRETVANLLPTVQRAWANKHGQINDGPPAWVHANPQHIQRLLRNGLDNAFSFARARVDIDITERGADYLVSIRDDGPGFSQESLQNFGRKRGTRYHPPQDQQRLSVGLGSVIMNAIAVANNGSIQAQNRAAKNPGLGSQLTICLPKASLTS